MTTLHFNSLREHLEYNTFLKDGVYLADRQTGTGSALLFELNGKYFEVYFNASGDRILEVRGVDLSDELDPYLQAVDLTAVL